MVKMIEGRSAVVVIDVQYDFLPGGRCTGCRSLGNSTGNKPAS